ncbi:helicase-associated domain-containing protein [Pseudofrankia sp. DC12]|uniref:helicase-associated domain-containing protein n=1 Tax=Pseudofrankia sp. DC12 TaxID=683315 RepID=UPI0005F81A5A|nr:helicase-associated domain-containing protein [Pseudofrankia sp. DC12]
MASGSFAEYLAGLDESALTGLLRARPDVLVEPVPRGFEQLAQRLCGPDSLVAALRSADRDAVVVGQAVAALGSLATVEAVTRLAAAPEQAVRDALDELRGRGLAWLESGTIRLPERLAEHWSAEIGDGRPLATIARSAPVEDVRSAAEALGVEVAGLRKPELIARLVDAVSDVRAMADVVRQLPEPARGRLSQLCHRYGQIYFGSPAQAATSADRALAAAGLVIRVNGRWEVPWEIEAAAWLARRDLVATGRPRIPSAAVRSGSTRAAAQAAAADLLRGVTALLDEARSHAIVALKKGGVGPREQSRLAARLALPAEVLVLVIDLTYAAGLLGRADTGYAPTDRYAPWREAPPARQWSALATAWLMLGHAPTSREIEGGKELPPPLPLVSAAGGLRRAVMSAARGGLSLRAAGEHADWFFPLHGYEPDQLRDKVAAAGREAELLGVAAADVLTECGEQLVALLDAELAGAEPADAEPVDALTERVAGVLVERPCEVILQSDLTAVVSGQPTTVVSRLLGTAAVSESRSTAGVWRFSPASVRAAFDAGWTAEQLLADLTAISNRPVPQPLEFLVKDVGRLHGKIRVRGMRSCVVAEEATINELLHTRSLAKLSLARVAPTVLSSPYELQDVLERLRAAGLSPVAEDATGTVIVEQRREHQASAPRSPKRSASRGRLEAEKLAARLLADPAGGDSSGADTSEMFARLAQLNPGLSDAEIILLADAVESQRDVLISYRNKTGNRTVREIQPRQLYGRWLDAWCHLRDDQRDFTVANIESVAPVG